MKQKRSVLMKALVRFIHWKETIQLNPKKNVSRRRFKTMKARLVGGSNGFKLEYVLVSKSGNFEEISRTVFRMSAGFVKSSKHDSN